MSPESRVQKTKGVGGFGVGGGGLGAGGGGLGGIGFGGSGVGGIGVGGGGLGGTGFGGDGFGGSGVGGGGLGGGLVSTKEIGKPKSSIVARDESHSFFGDFNPPKASDTTVSINPAPDFQTKRAFLT